VKSNGNGSAFTYNTEFCNVVILFWDTLYNGTVKYGIYAELRTGIFLVSIAYS